MLNSLLNLHFYFFSLLHSSTVLLIVSLLLYSILFVSARDFEESLSYISAVLPKQLQQEVVNDCFHLQCFQLFTIFIHYTLARISWLYGNDDYKIKIEKLVTVIQFRVIRRQIILRNDLSSINREGKTSARTVRKQTVLIGLRKVSGSLITFRCNSRNRCADEFQHSMIKPRMTWNFAITTRNFKTHRSFVAWKRFTSNSCLMASSSRLSFDIYFPIYHFWCVRTCNECREGFFFSFALSQHDNESHRFKQQGTVLPWESRPQLGVYW